MEMITLILTMSTVLCYVIDRLKAIWSDLSFGKYITMIIAAAGSFALAFSFKLDLVYALELVENITPAGEVLTALVLMSGSSAVSEIITRVKGEQ